MSSPALRTLDSETPAASLAAAQLAIIDEDEQREHAQELLMLLIGAGLLAVGWAWGGFQPDQA
ncbi:MAG TPA: hypothetical protein DFR83_21800, partial [Deltaproteobacteria bacterium]|nr:hypothetical protein [Deltaproteobacteria bacterium]